MCFSRKPQETPGNPRKPQETPGNPRKPQETPGNPRKPQEPTYLPICISDITLE